MSLGVRFDASRAGDVLRSSTHTTFVLHDATDGCRFGARESECVAVLFEEWIELLLAKVGVGGA